jgi:hypothetical protein
MRAYKNRMNVVPLDDMNEKEASTLFNKWKVQMRSCFITKKNSQEPKRSATCSKNYKT